MPSRYQVSGIIKDLEKCSKFDSREMRISILRGRGVNKAFAVRHGVSRLEFELKEQVNYLRAELRTLKVYHKQALEVEEREIGESNNCGAFDSAATIAAYSHKRTAQYSRTRHALRAHMKCIEEIRFRLKLLIHTPIGKLDKKPDAVSE